MIIDLIQAFYSYFIQSPILPLILNNTANFTLAPLICANFNADNCIRATKCN